MNARIDETLNQPNFDGLIAGNNPEPEIFSVTIRKLSAAANLKRGTILALSSGSAGDGKMVILGTAAATDSQKFSGDGNSTTFTVTAKPATIEALKVGSDEVTAFTYDSGTGVITCTAAPASGSDNVEAIYPAGEILTADCILSDDVDVGTTDDVKATAYRDGTFNRDKLIVAAGYTMTATDKHDLRMAGIHLEAAI